MRSCLNGQLVQERDTITEKISSFESKQLKYLLKVKWMIYFLLWIVKHTKSNTTKLAKDQQLLASGTGQTSRVDALKQAIHVVFGFDLNGAMASDAFFQLPVEIAGNVV